MRACVVFATVGNLQARVVCVSAPLSQVHFTRDAVHDVLVWPFRSRQGESREKAW